MCDYDQDGDGALIEDVVVVDEDLCDEIEGPGVSVPRVDCDDTDPELIDFEVFSMIPLDGSVGLPAPSVRIGVTGIYSGVEVEVSDGVALVPGSVTNVLGLFLVFTPHTPFAGATTFTTSLIHGCGVDTFAFTTP